MATTLISGGTVISAIGRREADVLIDGESVAALLAPGQAATMGMATALPAFPGASSDTCSHTTRVA